MGKGNGLDYMVSSENFYAGKVFCCSILNARC